MGKELSIYVHIPFCQRKCLYCDFLSFSANREQIRDYFTALRKELISASRDYNGYKVISVFFGGGTPSFPEAGEVCETLDLIRECFDVCKDAEISLEVNPASAIFDKLCRYRQGGFNRISIGAQSLDNKELKALGRLHDSETFLETYGNARRAGFQNINVDLMSALPGQDTASYLQSLKGVLELEPEHISAYSLIVEEGTPFFEMDLDLPGEDEDRLMYHETKRIFKEHGYHRYEISNYARSAIYECRHNKVYWKRGNYLGVGLGASSMVENTRWSNVCDIHKYIEMSGSDGIRENLQRLTTNAQMEEFMFLGLRLVEGISVKDFEREFGRDIFGVYGDVIDRYKRSGHLRLEKDMLSLTDEGLDVSNTVMADFLLDDG